MDIRVVVWHYLNEFIYLIINIWNLMFLIVSYKIRFLCCKFPLKQVINPNIIIFSDIPLLGEVAGGDLSFVYHVTRKTASDGYTPLKKWVSHIFIFILCLPLIGGGTGENNVRQT